MGQFGTCSGHEEVEGVKFFPSPLVRNMASGKCNSGHVGRGWEEGLGSGNDVWRRYGVETPDSAFMPLPLAGDLGSGPPPRLQPP